MTSGKSAREAWEEGYYQGYKDGERLGFYDATQNPYVIDPQESRINLSEIADRHAAEFLDATDPRGGDMYPVIRAAITDAVLDAWGEYA